MPIARSPGINTTEVTIPGAMAGEVISKGQTVALVDTGSGPVFMLCSSTTYAREFIGFATADVIVDSPMTVVARRGSTVEPVVELAAALTANDPVFLSSTLGEVTQAPPTASGNVVYQVGHAYSTTEMVLTTDFRVGRP